MVTRGNRWVGEFLVVSLSSGRGYMASDGYVFGKGATVKDAVQRAREAQAEFDSPVPSIIAAERSA